MPLPHACRGFGLACGAVAVAPWRCFLAGLARDRDSACSTHFRLLLSSITHLMPSIVQFEHVTSPSAVTWYLCMTSHLTFRARHAAHAFAARRLTGFGLPALSNPELEACRFLESVSDGVGERNSSLSARFMAMLTPSIGGCL